jgi:hypothetical protein
MTVGEAISILEGLSGEHGMNTPFGINMGNNHFEPNVKIEELNNRIIVSRAPDPLAIQNSSPAIN